MCKKPIQIQFTDERTRKRWLLHLYLSCRIMHEAVLRIWRRVSGPDFERGWALSFTWRCSASQDPAPHILDGNQRKKTISFLPIWVVPVESLLDFRIRFIHPLVQLSFKKKISPYITFHMQYNSWSLQTVNIFFCILRPHDADQNC